MMKNNKKFQDLTPDEIKRQMVKEDAHFENKCALEIRCHDGRSGFCEGDTGSGCSVEIEEIGGAWYASSITCIAGDLKTTIECDNSKIPGDRGEVNSGVATNPTEACKDGAYQACHWMEYGFLHSGRCEPDPNSHDFKIICVEHS